MKVKYSILVVDDEEPARIGLTKIIKNAGYNAKAAKSGKEALKILEEEPFDIVITDLKMPTMSGIELLKEIKKRWPEIGVIILTAYGEVESYLEAMDLGAFEYLNKPVRIYELEVIIKKLLEKKGEECQS